MSDERDLRLVAYTKRSVLIRSEGGIAKERLAQLRTARCSLEGRERRSEENEGMQSNSLNSSRAQWLAARALSEVRRCWYAQSLQDGAPRPWPEQVFFAGQRD